MDQSVDTTRIRKPRGQGASRRGEILEAAKHLFAEEGVAHVTMRRIGAAVGVSPTALYMHFADKDSLLAAIAQDTFSALLSRLEQSKATGRTPLERFRAGLRVYIEFGLARPDEYRLTFMTRLFRRLDAKTCAVEMADRSFAILEEGMAELIRDGVFRPGHPAELAEAVWAALHGTTALLLDQADNLHTAKERLVTASIGLIERGLLSAAHQDKPC